MTLSIWPMQAGLGSALSSISKLEESNKATAPHGLWGCSRRHHRLELPLAPLGTLRLPMGRAFLSSGMGQACGTGVLVLSSLSPFAQTDCDQPHSSQLR